MPDNIFLVVLIFAASLYVLMKGADWLIDGASALARELKISELIIGLTVIAFGTSLPEFVVSIQAAIYGSPELSYSNVVGSNIANILLILGATSLIMPLKAPEEVHKDIYFFFGLVLTFAVVVIASSTDNKEGIFFTSELGTFGGLSLLAFFVAFIFRIIGKRKDGVLEILPSEDNDDGEDDDELPLSKAILYLIAGTAMIILGGEFTVQSAIGIAQKLGVPESTIGLTIVAFGTSLPELVASLAAAGKKKGDMAIGNILGSNLMNLAFVLGSAATFFPIFINAWGVFDMLVHTLISFGFLGLMARRSVKFNLNRQTGIVFLILYVSYMTIIGMRDFVT
ncbi:calcium/sodium antiporter [Pseudobacteriovorax antillogorgiicola]|uniref:Cation:H+ antiporter n=1 Tax=Pseudobacteriovorax antillogorgiicola TaxID=1513793 RepID=A0A1Y6C7T3_9BACT|nr:calcium/sodium antiporter [Pseudobacteriovorax antillogorgiicola]TCS51719.1 cation:H+ antiporter [Pseudobacteriovorax antillogorgiicola]SMF49413.1 cation:H+ antiporter [Pseudobacteriovorax antillogorgiicola]